MYMCIYLYIYTDLYILYIYVCIIINDCAFRLQLQNTLEYSITYPDEQDPVVSNETDG